MEPLSCTLHLPLSRGRTGVNESISVAPDIWTESNHNVLKLQQRIVPVHAFHDVLFTNNMQYEDADILVGTTY